MFVRIVGRRTSTLKVIDCIVDWIGSVLDVLSDNDTMMMLVAKLVKVGADLVCCGTSLVQSPSYSMLFHSGRFLIWWGLV